MSDEHKIISCQSKGGSDHCAYCGRDMGYPPATDPECPFLKRGRLASITPDQISTWGCKFEADGLARCEEWCAGACLECPVSLKEAAHAAPVSDQVAGEPSEDSLEALMHEHNLIGVAGDDPRLEARLLAYARAAIAADRASREQVSEDEPPLPEPCGVVRAKGGTEVVFSADQTRQYGDARAAHAFEQGKRLAHEQALQVTHALMAEREEWKARAADVPLAATPKHGDEVAGLPDLSYDMLPPDLMRRNIRARQRERCDHDFKTSFKFGGALCRKCGMVEPPPKHGDDAGEVA
jgi:hypothetical protein